MKVFYATDNNDVHHLWVFCKDSTEARVIANFVLKTTSTWIGHVSKSESPCIRKYFKDKSVAGYVDATRRKFKKVMASELHKFPFVLFKTRAEKIEALLN